jgi:hypothetical protein
MSQDLKPETTEAFRVAWDAAARALVALADDPARLRAYEGGAIDHMPGLVRPESVPDVVTLVVTVRRSAVADVIVARRADLERLP